MANGSTRTRSLPDAFRDSAQTTKQAAVGATCSINSIEPRTPDLSTLIGRRRDTSRRAREAGDRIGTISQKLDYTRGSLVCDSKAALPRVRSPAISPRRIKVSVSLGVIWKRLVAATKLPPDRCLKQRKVKLQPDVWRFPRNTTQKKRSAHCVTVSGITDPPPSGQHAHT